MFGFEKPSVDVTMSNRSEIRIEKFAVFASFLKCSKKFSSSRWASMGPLLDESTAFCKRQTCPADLNNHNLTFAKVISV